MGIWLLQGPLPSTSSLEEHAPKYCCEEEGCYLLFSMDFLASDNKALAQMQLVNTSWF